MRARLVFEEFAETSDPVHDMGIGGYSKRTLDSMSFKVLQFIENKGKEGASLKEIQFYIWTELEGHYPEEFYKKSFSQPSQRKTRGHWNTNLLGGDHYHEGLLHKYCEKNPDTKKWVLKRLPQPKENMYVWPKR